MKLFTILSIFTASILSAATFESDWCAVKMPDSVKPGESVVIDVTLKSDPAGQKLCMDLHHLNAAGDYAGFLAWHPSQDAKAGAACRFTYKPNIDPSTMSAITPLVFLAPDGDFAKLTKRADPGKIKIESTPASIAETAALNAVKNDPQRYRRSSLAIRVLTPSAGPGDEIIIEVDYKLDARDALPGGVTKILLNPLGPWVDNPDGKYTTKRHHVAYPGLSPRTQDVKPGAGTLTFKYTLGKSFQYNGIQWMANFTDPDGKNWPWSVRKGGPEIKRAIDVFDVTVKRAGGLFKYGENPEVFITWAKDAPAARNVKFKITNFKNETVREFDLNISSIKPDTPIPIYNIKERGTFLIEASIEGVGARTAYFAIVPDNAKIFGDVKTPFGATNIHGEKSSQIVRALGVTYIRHFVSWNEIEPSPGEFRLEGLKETISANNKAQLRPWICLVNPPSWIMKGAAQQVSFEPFLFDEVAFERTATRLAQEFKGKIWGFEWLNEIVPGNATPTPVETYLRFCEIGTRAVKKVDPTMKIQMAGGLWPRNFRTDLLAAGIADHVDALPIHYSNRDGVLEAYGDAKRAGKALEIWDNESASGISVWDMPPKEAMTAGLQQSEWIMRNFPAELAAGATAVTYFGGGPDAAGNWSLFLDDTTPRPGAATLAVLASKLGNARPVGTSIFRNLYFHLFEKNDGKWIAVVKPVTDENIIWPFATEKPLVVTDYQGNETTTEPTLHASTLSCTSTPVFVENFDFKHLAVQCGINVGNNIDVNPQFTTVKDIDAIIPVKIYNPLRVKIEVEVFLIGHSTKPSISMVISTVPINVFQQKLQLLPHEIKTFNVVLPFKEINISPTFQVLLKWDKPVQYSTIKEFYITVVDPSTLGNLLKNGGIENEPVGWSGDAKRIGAQAFQPVEKNTGAQAFLPVAQTGMSVLPYPGLEGHALSFSGKDAWQHAGQNLKLPARGQTYLYSAWVWCEDMQAGSNLGTLNDSGEHKTYYIPAVFDAGRNTDGAWRYLSHRRAVESDIKEVSFTPVANGKGFARFDNIRVTLYQGSDFATEAKKADKKISIDGDLSDWDFTDDSTIPLLCDNQITARDGYKWTPQNLSGVAKFAWDNEALYFAAKIRDDVHRASTGADTLKSDSLVIALHPSDRADGEDAKAFMWNISSAVPGGGSGKHTLWRPPAQSGGLRSGQLAQDSSLYEISVKREGDLTYYELKIPWSETGGLKPEIGTRAGLSLQAIDYDNSTSSGIATWGGGLLPRWSPQSFGVLTLIP